MAQCLQETACLNFTLVQSLLSSWVDPDDSPKKQQRQEMAGNMLQTCSIPYARPIGWKYVPSRSVEWQHFYISNQSLTCSILAATKTSKSLIRFCAWVYWLELQSKIIHLSFPSPLLHIPNWTHHNAPNATCQTKPEHRFPSVLRSRFQLRSWLNDQKLPNCCWAFVAKFTLGGQKLKDECYSLIQYELGKYSHQYQTVDITVY